MFDVYMLKSLPKFLLAYERSREPLFAQSAMMMMMMSILIPLSKTVYNLMFIIILRFSSFTNYNFGFC